MKKIIKIMVFTDLHHGDVMPDCRRRIEKIIKAANEENVDFIVNLGDFATPSDKNGDIGEMWNNIKLPHYMTLGNHDLDCHNKEEVMDFYRLSNTYYAFEQNNIKFIFLDTNHYRENGKEYSYEYGNYHKKDREYISYPQMKWLEEEIEKTDKRCILFSHARLNYPNSKYEGGCGNYIELHELFMRLNQQAGWKKVSASINGHNHTSSYQCWDGIHHIDINSASNIMFEDEFDILLPNEIYDERVHELHPYLKYLLPYKEPLYAIITINEEEETLEVKERKTTFVGPIPQERKHSGYIGDTLIVPQIYGLKITL